MRRAAPLICMGFARRNLAVIVPAALLPRRKNERFLKIYIIIFVNHRRRDFNGYEKFKFEVARFM